ncbi:hypothetical protein LPJ75_002317 [Coemansia sp. RSA 2598]|nr:hypothetical protein LPJ75_002317 [Coemansia sp. RSA 2598]
MDSFSSSVPSFAAQSNAEPITGSTAASEYYSPSQQLQMEASRLVQTHAPTVPAMLHSASTHSFGSGFGSMLPPHGPATAPLPSSAYAETPSTMSAVVEFDNLLASAYQSYLSTPANPLDLASPQFHVARSQTTPSANGPLFAPLDEIRPKDAGLTNDILDQLALADPSLRQSLVHAIVDFIKPTVAYQLVEAVPAPSTSAASTSSASSSFSLFAQAQTLASAAVSLVGEPSAQQTPAMFADTPIFSDSGIPASDGPLMDSLLGLLSPPIADAMTPLAGPLVTDVATPIILGMLDSSAHAKDGAMAAPKDLLRTQDVEDVPLVQALAAPKPVSAKRAREDDDDDEESAEAGAAKRFHCDICNRGFSRQYNMRTHRQTHEPHSVKSRPFSCSHCPRTFTRKHDLVRHQVLHDDSSAFKCSVCSRGFARQDVLERHARAVHKIDAH